MEGDDHLASINTEAFIGMLREKDKQITHLQQKLDLAQNMIHQYQMERAKLEYLVQTLRIEFTQTKQIHQLELDAALTQKETAWKQVEASAARYQIEIQALQATHAAELEFAKHGQNTISNGVKELKQPLHAPSPPTSIMPAVNFKRKDDSDENFNSRTQGKTLVKMRHPAMKKLMSSGDTVSTSQEFENGHQRDGSARIEILDQSENSVDKKDKHLDARRGYTNTNQVSALTILSSERIENDPTRFPREKDNLEKINTTLSTECREKTQVKNFEQDVITENGESRNASLIASRESQNLLSNRQPIQALLTSSKKYFPTAEEIDTATNQEADLMSDGQSFISKAASFDYGQNVENVDDIHNQDDQSEPSEVSTTYGEDRAKVINEVLLDPYGDQGVYTGTVLLSTGMPHGTGRMVYSEPGRTYTGEWRHGRWNGFGKATFVSGDSYEGIYVNDLREGTGVYKWKDGRVYDGEFKDDKRHGKGTFIWPDSSLYDGDFVNGHREGHGIYQFADGGRYEGGWKHGHYNGVGTCVWADGRKYHGEWANGVAEGEGIEWFANGTVRHHGIWSNDQPQS